MGIDVDERAARQPEPTRQELREAAKLEQARSGSRWALRRWLHATLQRFALDWGQLPAGTARSWLRALAIGWAACAALMLGLVVVCRAVVGDETQLLGTVLDSLPLSFHAAIWAESPGNTVFMLPLLLIAVGVAIWRRRPLEAATLAAAFCLIDTLVLIGWLTWDRARPTLVLDGIAAPGFHAFPSGHVAQAIAFYGLLTAFWVQASRSRIEQTLALLICAALVVTVALARLRLGAHWPSDLLAGAVLGGAWLAALLWALRRAHASA